MTWASVTENFAKKCNERSRPAEKSPERLIKYYKISHKLPELEHALLSPGTIKKKGKKYSIKVCYSCFDSLSKTSRGDVPPKFSIANGFEIG